MSVKWLYQCELVSHSEEELIDWPPCLIPSQILHVLHIMEELF